MDISFRNAGSILSTLTVAFCVTLISAILICGQGIFAATDETIKLPKDEKFIESSELLLPWRESDRWCSATASQPRLECPVITVDLYEKSHQLTLFNSDGTVWYRFSVDGKKPDYFEDNPKTDFKPVATFT